MKNGYGKPSNARERLAMRFAAKAVRAMSHGIPVELIVLDPQSAKAPGGVTLMLPRVDRTRLTPTIFDRDSVGRAQFEAAMDVLIAGSALLELAWSPDPISNEDLHTVSRLTRHISRSTSEAFAYSLWLMKRTQTWLLEPDVTQAVLHVVVALLERGRVSGEELSAIYCRCINQPEVHSWNAQLQAN